MGVANALKVCGLPKTCCFKLAHFDTHVAAIQLQHLVRYMILNPSSLTDFTNELFLICINECVVTRS